MRGLIGWLAATIAGACGWWLGALFNLGVAVILGSIAGALGLYWGYRWFDEYLG